VAARPNPGRNAPTSPCGAIARPQAAHVVPAARRLRLAAGNPGPRDMIQDERG
jgi:hypothetical protein